MENERKKEDCLVHKYNIHTGICTKCGKLSSMTPQQLQNLDALMRYRKIKRGTR